VTALAIRRSREALVKDHFLNQLGELIAWGNGAFPADHPFRGILDVQPASEEGRPRKETDDLLVRLSGWRNPGASSSDQASRGAGLESHV
jgi:hypothetical protein